MDMQKNLEGVRVGVAILYALLNNRRNNGQTRLRLDHLDEVYGGLYNRSQEKGSLRTMLDLMNQWGFQGRFLNTTKGYHRSSLNALKDLFRSLDLRCKKQEDTTIWKDMPTDKILADLKDLYLELEAAVKQIEDTWWEKKLHDQHKKHLAAIRAAMNSEVAVGRLLREIEEDREEERRKESLRDKVKTDSPESLDVPLYKLGLTTHIQSRIQSFSSGRVSTLQQLLALPEHLVRVMIGGTRGMSAELFRMFKDLGIDKKQARTFRKIEAERLLVSRYERCRRF